MRVSRLVLLLLERPRRYSPLIVRPLKSRQPSQMPERERWDCSGTFSETASTTRATLLRPNEIQTSMIFPSDSLYSGKLLESASSISNANEYTLIEDKPPESRESTSKEEESPSTAQNKKEEESGPSPPTHTIPTSGPLQPPPESASAPKGSLLNPIVINATDPTEPTPLPPTESKEPTSSPPVPAEGPPVEVAPALSAPTETPLASAPIHVQMNHTPLTTASPVVTTVPPAPLPSYGETQPRPGNNSYMVSTTPSSSTSSLTVASPQVHQNRPNAGLPRPLNNSAPSTTMNGLNTGSPSAVNHSPYTNPMKPVASPAMNGPINKNPMNAMPAHNYAMNKNYNAMPNNMMVKNEPPKNVMPNRLPTPNYPAPPPSPLPGANGPVSTYQRSASSPRQSPNYNQPAPYTAPATTPKPYGAPSVPTSTVPLPGGQSLPPHYLSSNSPATGKTLPPVPVVKNYPPPNNINYNSIPFDSLL